MTRMLRVSASIFAFVMASPVAAQQIDEQIWLQATGSTAIDEDVSLTLESIARFSNRADGLYHTQFGGIVSYKVSPAVEIGFGYRHIQDYDHGRNVPNEERIRQTITVKLGSGFSTRTRIEQSFSNAGSGVAVQWRQLVKYSRPIASNGLAAFATHESFVNLNDTKWGAKSGYNRMRNAIGLQIPLAKNLRGEAGYLNQYRFGRSGARDRMDHAANFALSLTL